MALWPRGRTNEMMASSLQTGAAEGSPEPALLQIKVLRGSLFEKKGFKRWGFLRSLEICLVVSNSGFTGSVSEDHRILVCSTYLLSAQFSGRRVVSRVTQEVSDI